MADDETHDDQTGGVYVAPDPEPAQDAKQPDPDIGADFADWEAATFGTPGDDDPPPMLQLVAGGQEYAFELRTDPEDVRGFLHGLLAFTRPTVQAEVTAIFEAVLTEQAHAELTRLVPALLRQVRRDYAADPDGAVSPGAWWDNLRRAAYAATNSILDPKDNGSGSGR